MKTSLLASLEECLDCWIAERQEQGEGTEAWVPPDLNQRMAQAAAAVWDINESSQNYAEEQRVDE